MNCSSVDCARSLVMIYLTGFRTLVDLFVPSLFELASFKHLKSMPAKPLRLAVSTFATSKLTTA